MIVGDIVQVPAGTEIRVRMRLHLLVALFMIVWFGGLLSGAGLFLRQGLRDGFGPVARSGHSGNGFGLLSVGAILLLGYGVMSAAFWVEARRARVALRDGLGCANPD